MLRSVLSCCFLFVAFSLLAQTKTSKAIFIIVDGIPADVIQKLDPQNLKKIAKTGGFAKALVGGEKGGYSQTPTISAVGYNSVLTGTWVNKHNVWDNDIANPNYHYPTIFRLFKTQYPGKKIGIFSSWLDNRTKLVGDASPVTGNITVDYKLDGLELDTINYPHDGKRDFMHRIDERVTDEAALRIKENAPDLSWVYLEYTDDMSHAYGDSPEFYKAVDYADAQVGRIWEAIEYRQQQFNEDWLIIVTTDHGRDSISGHNHGGQSDRERAGWIVTNARGLNNRFTSQQSAIVDIMPTIARFMKIIIPEDTSKEVDGMPLIGRLSVSDPVTAISDNKLVINWKAQQQKGKLKIRLATTNNFKTGQKDIYHLIKKVALRKQHTVIDLSDWPADFYKVVLEGKYNAVNRWIKK